MTGEDDPERAALSLVKAGARLVVITLGADGAILRGELRADVPAALPVQVLSTVGAGDVLMGTILARLAATDFYPPRSRRGCGRPSPRRRRRASGGVRLTSGARGGRRASLAAGSGRPRGGCARSGIGCGSSTAAPLAEPHGHPIAELVLTVLSQSTNDRNRDVAYLALRERFRGDTWVLVRDAPVDEVEEAIRPGGISKVKSARIKSILRAITDAPRPDGCTPAGCYVARSRRRPLTRLAG